MPGLTEIRETVSWLAKVSLSGLLLVLTIAFFWGANSTSSISTNFPAFLKTNRDPGRWTNLFDQVYGNDVWYTPPRTQATSNSMLQVANTIMQCSQPWMLFPSSLCTCMQNFHTVYFNPLYLGKNPDGSPTYTMQYLESDARRELMKECLFGYRQTGSLALAPDKLIVSSHSLILYIMAIGFLRVWIEREENWDHGWLAAIIAATVAAHVLIPDQKTGLWQFFFLIVLAFVAIDSKWNPLQRLGGLRKHPFLEYVLVLPFLVLLYDITQQQRDWYYLMARIFSTIGLSLLVMCCCDLSQPKALVFESASVSIVWLMGTFFLITNTPPSLWIYDTLNQDAYWTSMFIPGAFYTFVIGIPTYVFFSVMRVFMTRKNRESVITEISSQIEMWNHMISTLCRLMLFMASIAAVKATN